MSLRIACDLDGTIADMEGALQREAEVLFGAHVALRAAGTSHIEAPSNPESRTPNPEKKVVTSRQMRQLWDDVVLDDRPENCLDVVTESNAKSLLIWRDRPEDVPPGAARLGIETVFSIDEAFQRIEALVLQPASASTPTTFVARVRSVIGI